VTDHKSLSHLQDQSLSTEMQRKTMVKLVGLQFKLQYRKGPNNKAANALSRVGHNFALQSSSMVVPVWLQEVTNAYATDPTAQRLLQELAIVSPNEEGYSLSQGLIIKRRYELLLILHCRLRSLVPSTHLQLEDTLEFKLPFRE
jgi:hypothetical protein